MWVYCVCWVSRDVEHNRTCCCPHFQFVDVTNRRDWCPMRVLVALLVHVADVRAKRHRRVVRARHTAVCDVSVRCERFGRKAHIHASLYRYPKAIQTTLADKFVKVDREQSLERTSGDQEARRCVAPLSHRQLASLIQMVIDACIVLQNISCPWARIAGQFSPPSNRLASPSYPRRDTTLKSPLLVASTCTQTLFFVKNSARDCRSCASGVSRCKQMKQIRARRAAHAHPQIQNGVFRMCHAMQ